MHKSTRDPSITPASIEAQIAAHTASQTTTHELGENNTQPNLDIEQIQLERLAEAVLCKSPDDLAALRTCNPELIAEWIEAFGHQQRAAERAARNWAAARAALKTVPPTSFLTAAE